MKRDIFQKEDIRKKSLETFSTAYNQLNAEQRQAVDMIEGPVMVIAGPGTGKTQILAVRIAKILNDTDAQAHNILCLTFTDAATIAMRQRLLQIIGPAAHQVHIFTFHSFCNQVIQENLGLFGDFRQLEPISDLEKVEVYQELIDNLPNDHVLKRLKSDSTFEARRLDNLFSMMKKENLTPKDIEQLIEEYIARRENDPKDTELYYQRKYKQYQAGDRKDAGWEKLQSQMHELMAGANLFGQYVEITTRLGRYDFQDMILWVLNKLKKDDHLLANYQERYQYVLVDEFQDTNGAQKDLLKVLISFWEENPNIFVVGDDDQAIYKFQGANIDNIKELRTTYDPFTVVLKNNYRSSQQILDLAKELIAYNTERIVNDDSTLDKNLLAASPQIKNWPRAPKIKSYSNLIHEQADIAHHLSEAYRKDEDLSKTAIIYRKHAQVEKLVEVLEKKGLPLNIKRKVDILKIPLVKNILTILDYINIEHKKPTQAADKLFEIMHYRFFPISSNDIARISLYRREADQKHLKNIIEDEALLNSLDVIAVDHIISLSQRLDKWISDLYNVTLQVLFQNIINEGHILQYVLLQPNKTWLLQVLSTFFDLIKDETTKNPDLDLSGFLTMIEKMKENNLSLGINKVIHSVAGVNFITAHSAKGLEFDKVFVPGVTKDDWSGNNRSNNHFKYPDNINEDVQTNIEDERRLLYVAITRAERELDISYSLQKEDGKAIEPSLFISEMTENNTVSVETQEVTPQVVEDFQFSLLAEPVKGVQLIDHDKIDEVLQKYKLSVTGLNKYLTCPLTFYFETILKVPTARTKYMGFGRAIHYAFEEYHEGLNKSGNHDINSMLMNFKKGMNHHRSHFTELDFEKMLAYGELLLPKYFDKYFPYQTPPDRFATEVKIDQTEYKGIPIKGVLDRVDVYKDYVIVTDYKTGNGFKYQTKAKLYAPSDKNPLGGDYWRQIVFYKMLLDNDTKHNWNMTTGVMDFIEPESKTDNFIQQKIVVSPTDLDFVGDQIVDVWHKIQKHEFDHGCGDENCYWCNFVKNEYVQIDLDSEQEDAIQDFE